MAQRSQSSPLGFSVRVPDLLCSLLERVYGFVQHHSALSRIAVSAPAADAALALSPRSRCVCVQRRKPANIYSGPRLLSWCLVLFSDSVCLEIPARVSSLAPASRCDCNLPETPFPWPASGDPWRYGTSLARSMGLARGLCSRGHAQSAGHQHSPFLHCPRTADSSTGTAAPHVDVVAGFEVALGASGNLADRRFGGYVPGHCRLGVSKLFSI